MVELHLFKFRRCRLVAHPFIEQFTLDNLFDLKFFLNFADFSLGKSFHLMASSTIYMSY